MKIFPENKKMSDIVIAIDGYSGTGKSSTAKQVAEELSYTYIDSGAMYRAITLYLMRLKLNIQDLNEVNEAIKHCNIAFDQKGISINGEHVEDQIRSMEVSNLVSEVSAISAVRAKLVEEQRIISANKGVVMDGRDIGTVVFPDAELKIFMTASMEVRVARRKMQLAEKNDTESLETIKNNLAKRDKIDSSRADSPLKKADDAIEIDTTELSFLDQVSRIVHLAKEKI